MKFRFSLIFVIILLILPLVFSADGYTILSGTSEMIDEHGECWDVSYDGSEDSIFVPTKHADEWLNTSSNSFIRNPPEGVSFGSCCECTPWSNTSNYQCDGNNVERQQTRTCTPPECGESRWILHETCSGGTPICDDATCVECVVDGDCPDGVCVDYECVECVVDDDCDGGYLCVMNKCRTINPHEVDCFWGANKSICETNLFWSDGKSNEHEEQHEAAFIVGGCDDNDETVLDTFTNTCYTRDWNLPGGGLNWQNAMNFCENLALCDDGTWDGDETTEGTCSGKTIEKNDWVLPTKREILRAVDYNSVGGSGNPMIVGGNNNIFNNVQIPRYWSSSRRTASGAWGVRLSNGLVYGPGITDYAKVVCVSRNE